MEIIEVKTKKDKKEYLKFLYKLYEFDDNYSDMNTIFVKNFLFKKDSYAKRCNIIPLIIKDDSIIKLECIFIIDDTDEIKLSFIEFVKNSQKYLIELIAYSKKLMKEYKKKKTVIGINGQVSYGLGILTKNYNQCFEFNSNYNLDYYTDEMDDVFSIIKRAFSYKYNADHSLSMFDKKLIDDVNKNYKFRFLDLKHFKRDMLIFGKLCHEALKETPYYSEKTPYEMYELMKKVKFIIKKEDIIFALKDGKEIGFVYTHPNYAELFSKPKLNYISFYLRFLFKKTNNVIYNIIGVLPEHQLSGVAVSLIHKSILMRKEKYSDGVSSFILEDNIASTKLCKKLSVGINKEFHLYEIEADNNV